MLVDYVHVYSYAVTSIPDVPTGLSETASGTQVALSWSPANGATNYNVKRSMTNGGPYAIVGSTASTSYTDTGLANGTTYYYVVSAVNSFWRKHQFISNQRHDNGSVGESGVEQTDHGEFR